MEAYLRGSYKELETEFDEQNKALWCHMDPNYGASFSFSLLRDLLKKYQSIENIPASLTGDGKSEFPLKYVVQASKIPGVWNYGGDLQLFTELIRKQDRQGLFNYAKLCIDALHLIVVNFNLPIISVALVQGDALGGGFEMVLAHDMVIAERRAKFGLTEVLFNLFPGMGAYSFLARRVGIPLAEKMMFSGKIYSAEELYEMGLVNILAEDGKGHEAVQKYMESNERRYEMQRAVYKIRQRFSNISHKELLDITTIWVDSALRLHEADLRKMERLANAQIRKNRPKQDEQKDKSISIEFNSLKQTV